MEMCKCDQSNYPYWEQNDPTAMIYTLDFLLEKYSILKLWSSSGVDTISKVHVRGYEHRMVM